MIVTIQCTGCSTTARVNDQVLGRKIRCKHCQTVFVANLPPQREEELPTLEPVSPVKQRGARPSRDYEDTGESFEEPRSNNGLWIGLGIGGGAILLLVIILAVTLGGGGEPVVEKTEKIEKAEPKKKTIPQKKTLSDPLPLKLTNVKLRQRPNRAEVSFDFVNPNPLDANLPPLMLVLVGEKGETLYVNLSRMSPRPFLTENGNFRTVLGPGGPPYVVPSDMAKMKGPPMMSGPPPIPEFTLNAVLYLAVEMPPNGPMMGMMLPTEGKMVSNRSNIVLE